MRLTIYDSRGHTVRTLVDGPVTAGRHDIQWDGTDDNGSPVASGSYFYRLRIGNETLTKRMVLLK